MGVVECGGELVGGRNANRTPVAARLHRMTRDRSSAVRVGRAPLLRGPAAWLRDGIYSLIFLARECCDRAHARGFDRGRLANTETGIEGAAGRHTPPARSVWVIGRCGRGHLPARVFKRAKLNRRPPAPAIGPTERSIRLLQLSTQLLVNCQGKCGRIGV